MNKLIQTGVCSIIYGTFRGKKDQELFRCPRELDDVDLPRYINETRSLIGFDDDSNTEDLRDVEGMKMIGYYRLYFRGGWFGRWMPESDVSPSALECNGIDNIVDWLREEFPCGCSFDMEGYFRDNFKPWGVGDKRYVIRPKYCDFYRVMVDTTFGNGDYPVRIYVYRKEA